MSIARASELPALGGRVERGALVRATIIAAILAFVLLAVPELTSTRWELIFTATAIYSVVAMGAGVLYGRVGMVSLCQIALLAVGGWVGLRLLYGTGLPFELVVVITGLITMVIGTLIGLPALRLSGLYLALITLMAAAAISVLLRAWNFPNGGPGFKGVQGSVEVSATGVRRPDIALGNTAYYRYAVIVCGLMFLLALWHVSSKPGRAWSAIRQSEPAALAGGVNITLYKLWAFALASFVTGVAGAVLASSGGGQLNTYAFQTQDSILLLAVVLMGGIFSLWGAVIAGLFLRVLPELLKDWGVSGSLLTILFGIGVIQVILTAPGGLVDQVPKDLAKLGRAIRGLFARKTGTREGEAA